MADIYQALSSPVRREILAMLKKEDLTAGDISERIDIAKSTLSGHFNVLKEAGLVVTVKSGTTITYSLNTSVVEELMSGLMNLFGSNASNEKEK
ncbi:autorepressor SdpR family transcription factor [Psychrosphaera sp.]|nr:autorepressor SdpR family transcription factor [Psychrosphaera sp.]